MIRTKDRFYWKDLLYLTRARDGLRCIQSGSDYDLYQCLSCSAIIRFKMADAKQQNGLWIRIKPYEYFQIIKSYPSVIRDEVRLEKQDRVFSAQHDLYRCRDCASYWWKEKDGWTRADDEISEHQ